MHSPSDSTRSLSDDQVTLLSIVQVLRSNLRLIISIVTTALILSLGLAFLLTPVYDAKVVMVEAMGTDNRTNSSALLSQVGGLGSLMGIDFGNMGATQTSGMTVIQSRTILEEFIQRNNLMQIVLADYWDESNGKWDPSLGREPELWEAAEAFKENFSLEADKVIPDYLILTIEWTDPKLAAEWANELVALADQLTRQYDIAEAERSIQYLNKQIEQTDAIELKQVLFNLLQSKQEMLMLANSRLAYAFKVVDPAVVPVEPSRPKKITVVVIGTFFGLLFSLFLVFLLRVIQDLKEQERIEKTKQI